MTSKKSISSKAGKFRKVREHLHAMGNDLAVITLGLAIFIDSFRGSRDKEILETLEKMSKRVKSLITSFKELVDLLSGRFHGTKGGKNNG